MTIDTQDVFIIHTRCIDMCVLPTKAIDGMAMTQKMYDVSYTLSVFVCVLPTESKGGMTVTHKMCLSYTVFGYVCCSLRAKMA